MNTPQLEVSASFWKRFWAKPLSVLAMLVSGGAVALLIGQSGPASHARTFGPVSAAPDYIVVGTSTPILFTAEITDRQLKKRSVVLVRFDSADKPTDLLGRLRDDGKNGDVEANDSIYSLRVSLNESTVGRAIFRVAARFKPGTWTEPESDDDDWDKDLPSPNDARNKARRSERLAPLLRKLQRYELSEAIEMQVDPRSGGAVDGETLVFREAGQTIFTVPLADRTAVLPNGDTEIVNEGALVSDDGTHAIVFSTLATIPAQVIEGVPVDTARYFDISGPLWTRTTTAGREFMRGPARLISLNGSTVVLASAESALSQPAIDVYSAQGALIFAVPQGHFIGVYRVELSPSGQYLLLIGSLEEQQGRVIRVIDTSTTSSWEFALDSTEAIPQISITPDGRFEIHRESASTILPPPPL